MFKFTKTAMIIWSIYGRRSPMLEAAWFWHANKSTNVLRPCGWEQGSY